GPTGLATIGAMQLVGVPMCDVDLPSVAHISDDEDYRFQMGVSTFGYEKQRHDGGVAYAWKDRAVMLRGGVHLRLVNVGPAGKVRQNDLGFPVCTVCGQSRSPLASDADLDDFRKLHVERCGKPVVPVGFYADVVADALS